MQIDVRDAGSVSGLGSSPRGGHSNPIQYSCLKNPMDRGAGWAMVHRVAKSQTWLKQVSMHTCTNIKFKKYTWPTHTKKGQNNAICRDMGGPRDCSIEWSKSEWEKQIEYINAYMWNLEKWYRWFYLQSRNRHKGRKQLYGYQRGKVGDGRNWKIGIDTYVLLILHLR